MADHGVWIRTCGGFAQNKVGAHSPPPKVGLSGDLLLFRGTGELFPFKLGVGEATDRPKAWVARSGPCVLGEAIRLTYPCPEFDISLQNVCSTRQCHFRSLLSQTTAVFFGGWLLFQRFLTTIRFWLPRENSG